MPNKIPFANPDIETHHKLVEWAALCAERTLPLFEKDMPGDDRPRLAIESLRQWIRGEKTMIECREAAFQAHAAAREAANPAAVASARATGQAVAVAHMYNHCSHAADYAAKAAKLANPENAKAFSDEREWQWQQLAEGLRSIGFPKGR